MRKLLALLAAAAGGCGDNSRACGPGTRLDNQGYCVAELVDASSPCGLGTQLDPVTNKCVVSPGVCPDGTILIGDRCADPHGNLAVDLEEAPEPNGLGVIEASVAPAGIVALRAEGEPGFVIHGRLAPSVDVDHDMQLDPDVDTYEIEVSEPTLLHVTVAGVGVVGGFWARPASGNPLASWQRFGLAASAATSMRQIYLPRAGNYLLAIADSRTLFQYSTGGPIAAAPGPGEYYVTIDHVAQTEPPSLSGAHSGTLDADTTVQRFVASAPPSDIKLLVPSRQVRGALVISTLDGSIVKVATAPLGTQLDLPVSGFPAGDTLIVLDPLYDTATAAASYTLTTF